MSTKALQAEYERVYGKPPAVTYKNNIEWLNKKINEAGIEGEKKEDRADEIRKVVIDGAVARELKQKPNFIDRKAGKKVAHIFEKGVFVRTYSSAVHGGDFWKHAESYCRRQHTEAKFE